MKKRAIISGTVILSIVFCVVIQSFRADLSAQTVSETETSRLQMQIETFFETIAEPSGTATAYSAMFSETQAQDPPVQEMIQKTTELTRGTRWTSEFLDAKPVGRDLILIRYLYKSESHPVVWYFTFYRSQTARSVMDVPNSASTWNCIGIKFDTNLDVFFSESGSK